MFEIIGALVGGLFRMAPEVMGHFDKKNERKQELALFDRQLQADQLRSSLRIAEADAEGQIILDGKGLDALSEAIKGQGQLTGVAWIDGLTQSVRPIATYILLSLYVGAKLTGMLALYEAGVSVDQVFALTYSTEDRALLSGILNFWFLDRVIRKRNG